MASKVSPNSIASLDQDWSRDPSYNNYPFSGANVQAFIKRYLGDIAHAAYFDPNTYTMYWFASDADLQAWRNDSTSVTPIYSTVISFSNDLWRIYLTNNNNTTTINTSTNAQSLNLSVDFDVQWKTLSDSSWTSMGQGVYVTTSVDIGATGQYTVISDSQFYSSGSTVVMNIMPYLASGVNRVKMSFVAEENETVVATLTYTINVSEMFIELLNNTWYTPIIEGGDVSNYKLGGFRIIGSLNKTLVLDIYSGDSKVTTFTKIIGTTVYDTVPYNYTKQEGLDFSELNLRSGVYRVVAYLRSGTLESLPVQYNIMYVANSDITTAQLVCFNEVADLVYNYTNATLCKYSIYNKGATTGSPHVLVNVLVGTTPTAIVNNTYNNIETEVAHPLVCQVDWISDSLLEQSVQFTITFGNQQTAIRPLDNTFTFPPTAGYTFYMNSASRLNSNLNHIKLVNIADNNSELSPEWTHMVWLDGVDGWTEDDSGRACLRIPARSYMNLSNTEYQMLNPTQLGETFEICFKVSNVSDYDEDIITIATGREQLEDSVNSSFRGIRIKPNKIVVHSSLDATTSDTLRGTNFIDEQTIHLVITWFPNYNGVSGRNLVTGYINGCKNFQFDYTNQAVWNTPAPLIIGSEKSDISVYFIRKYDTVLSDAAVAANYINSLQSVAARQDLYELLWSVMDNAHTSVDYETVKNNDYNYFVIEMLDGATVPSAANGWSSTSSAVRSNLEMHYGQHPEWDWKIYNVETSGQGTTSMNYYRWNLRWRIDKTNSTKKVPISQSATRSTLNNTYVYEWSTPTDGKAVYFDGTTNSVGNHPAVKRITAKINMASSMQSHKIGATRAYTALHDAVVGYNDVQNAADQDNNPIPTVAVYEYPVYGFVYNPTENSYSFIGLFTIGPDKGDKPTFGYNYESTDSSYVIEDSLITLEGTDHSQRLAQFSYPYKTDASLGITGNTGNVVYDIDEECLSINLGGGDTEVAWEVGNCHGLETSTDKSWTAVEKANYAAQVKAVLDTEWQPAYDIAYSNNVLIFPVELGTYASTAADTIAYINDTSDIVVGGITTNNLNLFRATQYNPRLTYADMQFWIQGEYKLYYYDVPTNQYRTDGVNLATLYGITTTGKTVQEINDEIIAKRCANFRANALNYWNIQDCLFHLVFCMLFGATDNFAKNSYPYKMKALANGGRWCWRQDDLDTIFDIDNSGGQTKPYWIEFEDANNGTSYFAGGNSFFWNVLFRSYQDEIRIMGRNVMNAMSANVGGTNVYEGAIAFIKKHFWDNAQNYFPQSAYNSDGFFKYETAWLADGQNVDPLSQSLGNHYSAEELWVRNRIIYMMSLFGAGAFYAVDDQSLGRISFRASGAVNLGLTPVMNMYPTYGLGQQYQSTGRTVAGETQNVSFSGGNDTTVYIAASDYLSSIGNLKDLVLTTLSNLNVNGKKLVVFLIGDENAETVITPAVYYTQEEIDAAVEGDDAYGKTTEDIKTPAVTEPNVTTNIPGLTFPNNYCLEKIDARNAESLTGSLDLSNCKRLREGYFEGTNLNSVILPRGVKIESLHLPESTTAISLRYLKYLTDLELPEDLSNITVLHVENCDNQNAIQVLTDVLNSADPHLQYIRLVSLNQENGTATTMKMLAGIASGDYYGVSSSGSPDSAASPLVDLTMNVTSGVYESDLEDLQMATPTPYGEDGLVTSGSLAIRGLNLIWDPNFVYIPFADNEVKRIAIATWGDGEGVTMARATSLTGTFGRQFTKNATIVSFDEFQYFEGITATVTGQGLTTTNGGSFGQCTNLESIVLPASLTTIGAYTFYECSKLAEVNLENVTSIGANAFMSSGITKLENLRVTTIPASSNATSGCFYNCKKLTEVVLPSTLTKIGWNGFKGCTSLAKVTFPDTQIVIGRAAFYGCSKLTSIKANVSSFDGSYDQFGSCSALETVDLSGGTFTSIPSASQVGGGQFDSCTSLVSVALPTTCTSIGSFAFYDCPSLTTVTGTQNVTYIGRWAFQSAKISSIDLSGVQTLMDKVFQGSKLTSVNMSSLVSVGGSYTGADYGSFYNVTTLQSVNIGPNCTSIAAYTFRGCTALSSFTISATTPPSLGTGALESHSTQLSIFVPVGTLPAYRSATNWSLFYAYFQEIGHNSGTRTFNQETNKFMYGTSGAIYTRTSNFSPNITPLVEIPSTCTTIKYKAGITETVQINGAKRDLVVNFYDENEDFVGYILQKDNELTDVPVPAGAKYVRMNMCYGSSNLADRYCYILDVTNDAVLWPFFTEDIE